MNEKLTTSLAMGMALVLAAVVISSQPTRASLNAKNETMKMLDVPIGDNGLDDEFNNKAPTHEPVLTVIDETGSETAEHGCRNGTVCPMKCCPKGSFLVLHDDGEPPRCFSADENGVIVEPSWGTLQYNDSLLDEVELSPGSFITMDMPPTCDGEGGWKAFQRHFLHMDPIEALHVLIAGDHGIEGYVGPKYCMDYLKTNDSHIAKDVTLLCFPPAAVEEADVQYDTDLIKRHLLSICLVVSSVTLLLTFALTYVAPDPHLLMTLTLRSLICSLFLASLLMICLQLNQLAFPGFELPDGLCYFLGFLSHYVLLVAFLWSNILGFDIWRTMKNVPMIGMGVPMKYMKRGVYAYGGSGIITVLAIVFQTVSRMSESFPIVAPIDPEKNCLYTDDAWIQVIFFDGPMAVVFLLNSFFFASIGQHLLMERRRAHNLYRHDSTVKRYCLFASISCCMELGWVAELINWRLGSPGIIGWFVLANVMNTLAGLATFISYIVPRRTRDELSNLVTRWLASNNALQAWMLYAIFSYGEIDESYIIPHEPRRSSYRRIPLCCGQHEGNFEIEHPATTAPEAEGQVHIQMAVLMPSSISNNRAPTADRGSKTLSTATTTTVILEAASSDSQQEPDVTSTTITEPVSTSITADLEPTTTTAIVMDPAVSAAAVVEAATPPSFDKDEPAIDADEQAAAAGDPEVVAM